MPGIVEVDWDDVWNKVKEEDLEFDQKISQEIKELLDAGRATAIKFYYHGADEPPTFSLGENGFDNLDEFLAFLKEVSVSNLTEYRTPGARKYDKEQQGEDYEDSEEVDKIIIESNKLKVEYFGPSQQIFQELEGTLGKEYFERFRADLDKWGNFFMWHDDKIIRINPNQSLEEIKKISKALKDWNEAFLVWHEVGKNKNPPEAPPPAYTGIEEKVDAEAAAVADEAGELVLELDPDPEAAEDVESKAGAEKKEDLEQDEFYIEMQSGNESEIEDGNEEEIESENVNLNGGVLFRKIIGKKLADLAKDLNLKAFGSTMDQKTFNLSMQTWFKKVKENKVEYPDVTCDFDQDWFRTTVKVNEGSGNLKKDEIRHKYDSQRGCPKITMTNPPDDQTIYLFMESSAKMAPLTLDPPPCGPDQAIRLFEASVISGVELVLRDEDKQALLKSRQYGERYKQLMAIQKDSERLKQFQKEVSALENYKLGHSNTAELAKPLVMTFTTGKNRP